MQHEGDPLIRREAFQHNHCRIPGALGRDDGIRALNADGATASFDTGINDLALSASSRYLYALGVGDSPAIHAFRVLRDGQLEPLGTVGGLPAGDGGLAAR